MIFADARRIAEMPNVNMDGEIKALRYRVTELLGMTYINPDCQRFVKRLRREIDHLFVFMNSVAEYHNNYSEQSLRGFALARKVSYGSRSDRGLYNTETIAMIYETCRMRGICFFDFVTELMGKYDGGGVWW